VDESGRIMAPPGLEADPEGEAADPIVDNGTMSSSRSRSGSSRSGIVRRASSENAASSGKAETPVTEPPEADAEAATDATATGSDNTVSLPADPTDKPPGDAPVDNSAAKDDTRPMFASPWPAPPATATSSATPSEPVTLAPPPAAPPPPTGTRPASAPYLSSPYSDTSSYAGSSNHQGPGATPQGSPYVPPSSYPRPGWTNPVRRADQAPPLGTPQPPSPNGHTSSNGLPPGVAPAAAAGATAGLAGSMTSGWQRGAPAPAPAPADSSRNWQGARSRKASKRQAMLTLARVEPWSVMKFSFVASVAAFIILFVAVAVLYMILAALGVFDSLENTVSSVTSSQGSAGTNISHWFSPSLILGYTAMLGAFNIVIITAISTVGSVIYNLIAKLFGGIEVTLRETD